MKGVIFDLDGTLVDSIFDLGDCLTRQLEKRGLTGFSYDEYRLMVGRGFDHLLKKAYPSGTDAQMKALKAEYLEEYTLHLTDKTIPYPGIPGMLKDLKSRRIPLGVFTNKAEPQAVKIVEHLFGRGFFSFIRGNRADTALKPSPDGVLAELAKLNLFPRDVLFVGDSAVDVKTALNGNMVPCGVLWGYREKAEMEEAGAKIFISRPEEILGFL